MAAFPTFDSFQSSRRWPTRLIGTLIVQRSSTTFAVVCAVLVTLFLFPGSYEITELETAPMRITSSLGTVTPVLRIIVLGESRLLTPLLELCDSLAAADYGSDTIALDLWVDHSLRGDAQRLVAWNKGPLHVHQLERAGPLHGWLRTWSPGPDGEEVAIFVADTEVVDPAYYTFLKDAHMRYNHSMDIAGIALHSTKILKFKPGEELQEVVDTTSSVVLYNAAIETRTFSPISLEVWNQFRMWFESKMTDLYFWPFIRGSPTRKGSEWDYFLGSKDVAWNLVFSRFCHEFELSILYPGRGGLSHSTNHGKAQESFNKPQTLEAPVRYSFSEFTRKSQFVSEDSLAIITKIAHQNNGWVSLTVVTHAFVSQALSWLCNVDALEIRPPAIIWLVADADSYNALKDVRGTLALHLDEFSELDGGVSYGTKGYWTLMLERSKVVDDILGCGISVFAFETDQVWFRDPLPLIRSIVREGADIIGALDSKREIGGNLLFFRSSLATREVSREIVAHFQRYYDERYKTRTSHSEPKYLPNDQSLLSNIVIYHRSQSQHVQQPRFFAIPRNLIRDGLWYTTVHGYQPKLGLPMIVNNNFIVGVSNKIQRLKQFGHWFLDNETCNTSRARDAVKGATFVPDPPKATIQEYLRGLSGEEVRNSGVKLPYY
uniref:Nucleotide-diphospho-sugar transferase domain-containing protein n=1 Tax=Compsopogon caeruleus TaxID=31354 RepID=A0A7S1TGF3_9RHOD|mmetsp:Transcript_4746/g.9592  ORF Transcript_4746/g.9592 Transcript_4746/m.9592 type:complete len:660 (+) Transcript_4746:347-2326(+)